ncbi:MAG: MFS transporter [Actinomycetota bacterium]
MQRATSAGSAPAPTTGPFYGWIVVSAVFVTMAISSGVGFYNASVILSAATRELDASVGSVSGATGLFFAIGGLTGFVFSKRMESVDIRWFFLTGGIIGAVALLGLRWVTSVTGLYLFFAVFGIGFGLAGLVPSTTVVTRWFDRRRSVALSIASTGLSVGGIVVTPVADWIIDQRSLSGAAPYLAAIWLLGIVPIAVLLVRSYPADLNLEPDGARPVATAPAAVESAVDLASASAPAAVESPVDLASSTEPASAVDRPPPSDPAAPPGLDFGAARTTRFFLALCAAYAAIFLGQVGGIAQLFNMVLERTDAPTARTALATLAFASVVARLIGGAAVIRLPTREFSAGLAVLQAAALCLLAVASSSTSLILAAALFGCSIGNLLMLQPLLLAEAFGVANYGRIYSFNQLVGTLGVAGGPLLLGVLRDAVDYRLAFFAAAAASLVGFGCIVAAGPVARVQALWEEP